MSDSYPIDDGTPVSHATNDAGKTIFHSKFVDSMEMYADANTVAAYLDDHPEWFRRCALPMKTEPLGDNGYALIVGRYGNFGYEVEPRFGLHLLPPENRVYRIETIPVPDYTPAGYDIDFQASMELVEHESPATDRDQSPSLITHVQWDLDLQVTMQFPKFIQALPQSLIQGTGEALLKNVIKQVSRQLTQKVQKDFHSTRHLDFPKAHKRWLF
jgi:hypothetical protein